MFWKIAEESRLTFRGGDSLEKTNKRKEALPPGGGGGGDRE